MKTFEQINAQMILELIISGIFIINTILAIFGMPLINIGTEELSNLVHACMTIGTFCYVVWRNFPFTKAAKEGQQIIQGLKTGEIEEITVVGDTEAVEVLNSDDWEEETEKEINVDKENVDDKAINEALQNEYYRKLRELTKDENLENELKTGDK